jgi:hypothetical protein
MGAGSSRSALKDESIRDEIARDFIYNILPNNKEYMNAITKSYKELRKKVNMNNPRMSNKDKNKLKKKINEQEESQIERMWRQYEAKSPLDKERYIVSILDVDGKSKLENAVYKARRKRNEENARRRSLNGKSRFSLPTLFSNNITKKAKNNAKFTTYSFNIYLLILVKIKKINVFILRL